MGAKLGAKEVMLNIDTLSLDDWKKLTAIVAVLFGILVTAVSGIYTLVKSRKSKEEKEKLNLEIQHLKKELSLFDKQHDDECDNLIRPDYYSFEYLKKKAICDYGPECGILTIQYGSSVGDSVESANDIDYLVLIHGNYYTNESRAEVEGGGGESDLPNIPNVDIQKRLYDAFLFGLAVGKPYNVSVALDGRVKNYHNISPNYWRFIQLIVVNIRFRKDTLLSEMDNEILEYEEDFYREVTDGNRQESVIAAYNYVCSIIQRYAISMLPDEFGAREIYPLSKPKNLEKYVNKDKRGIFLELIDVFKGRGEMPPLRSLGETLKLLKEPM